METECFFGKTCKNIIDVLHFALDISVFRGYTKDMIKRRLSFSDKQNIAIQWSRELGITVSVANIIRLQRIYYGMLQRCYKPYILSYKYYGKKGISICDEWKNNRDTFCKWALTHGYTDTLTIDRIDVNGGYSPENCRWISAQEQTLNKCNTVRLTYRGTTKPLLTWCREMKLSYVKMYCRLRSGWSVERAFETK